MVLFLSNLVSYLEKQTLRLWLWENTITLGEPRAEEPYHSSEDPTLTPFENNARTKAGFGGSAFAAAAAAAGAFANLRKLLLL